MRKIKLFTIALSMIMFCACAQENETVVPTVTPTVEVVTTIEATPTVEVVATPTVEVGTPTIEPTVEVTPTVTPTIEVIPTIEVAEVIPTIEVVPTSTVEVTSTAEVTLTATPVPTVEVTPTIEATPTATPVPTKKPTPMVTPTVEVTPTIEVAPTVVPTSTPVPTKKPTPTAVPTVAPTPTPTKAVSQHSPKFIAMLEQAAKDFKAYFAECEAWEAAGSVGEPPLWPNKFDYGYKWQVSAPSYGAASAVWLSSLGVDCSVASYDWKSLPEDLWEAFFWLNLDEEIYSAYASLERGEEWTPRVYPRVQIIGGEGEEPLVLTEMENEKIIDFIDEVNRLKATLPYDKKFIEDCYDITSTEEEAKELIKLWSSPAPYVLDYWATKAARQRAYMIIEDFKHLDGGMGGEVITTAGYSGVAAADAYWNSMMHKPFIETFGDRSGGAELGLGFTDSTCCGIDSSIVEWVYNQEEMSSWREAHPELKGIAY